MANENPLRLCLNSVEGELVDHLFDDVIPSRFMGKNDMAIVLGLTSAAALMVVAHCKLTGQDFDELADMVVTHFDNALAIAWDKTP